MIRLLNIYTFKLESFFQEFPPYAILSHTWGSDHEETSFGQVQSGDLDNPANRPNKLEGCCNLAKRQGLEYVWIDTCCINKDSATELAEALASMFRWYGKAAACYAYLSDVTVIEDNVGNSRSGFVTSRWFRRGWTLQELLAPKCVLFYDKEWQFLGKSTDDDLSETIHRVTGIHRRYLLGTELVLAASVAQRMSWASKRETKVEEDLVYCLLGIFNISMRLQYGEGVAMAFSRFQEKIFKNTGDESILAWGFNTPAVQRGNLEASSSCGNLASHPSYFASSVHILLTEQPTPSGSLNLTIATYTDQVGNIFGLLRCGPENDAESVVGIPLIPLRGVTDNVYMRAEGSCAVLLPKSISGNGFGIVRLKRQIRSGAADCNKGQYWFRISYPTSVRLDVIEVEPASHWDKERSLISAMSVSNGNCIRQTWMRFRRRKARGEIDFLIMLDFKGQRNHSSNKRAVSTRGLSKVQVYGARITSKKT